MEKSKELAGFEAARDQKISELEILRQSLEAHKNRAALYYDQILRLKAEYENFRKRQDQERGHTFQRGRLDALSRMISLTDVLEMASEHAKTASNPESIAEGIEILRKEFLKFLKEEGITSLAPETGEPFDPARHEAVERVAGDGQPNKVLEVLRPGYIANGEVLRPAQVKVSA